MIRYIFRWSACKSADVVISQENHLFRFQLTYRAHSFTTDPPGSLKINPAPDREQRKKTSDCLSPGTIRESASFTLRSLMSPRLRHYDSVCRPLRAWAIFVYCSKKSRCARHRSRIWGWERVSRLQEQVPAWKSLHTNSWKFYFALAPVLK